MERIYPWTFLGGHHQMIGFGWMLGHQPITERKSKKSREAIFIPTENRRSRGRTDYINLISNHLAWQFSYTKYRSVLHRLSNGLIIYQQFTLMPAVVPYHHPVAEALVPVVVLAAAAAAAAAAAVEPLTERCVAAWKNHLV